MSSRLRALPSFAELDDMDVPRREEILMAQLMHDLDNGGDFVSRYRAWQKRCSYVDEHGERCTNKRMDPEQGTRCTRHFDLKDFDPAEWSRARAVAARVRMAELLDKSVTRLEEIIDDEDVPTAVRLKAVENIFDRAGVARTQAVSVDAEVTVEEKSPSIEIVRERLRALAVPVRSTSTAELPAASGEG